MRGRLGVVALALVLLAAACGGDDGGSSVGDDTAAPTSTTEAPFENSYADYTSEVYGDDAVWLCRPDLAGDVCDSGLDATVVEPDGTLTPQPFEPAVDPGFDCFYVYPTIDYSPEPGNHPFDEPNPLESVTVQGQAGRFGSICDLYVPRYRQGTIGSYPRDGSDMYEVEAFEVAYADVLDAFRTYLATWNDGRPFVLLGHSQGSHHLARLLQEELDPSPALRGRLISALLIGPTGRVQVPEGEVVGGTFTDIPVCTEATETGCVVAFDSWAEAEPPTFSLSGGPGLVRPCVDPAELVDGDHRLTASVFGRTVPGVDTLFEVVADHYTATCVEGEGGSYLSIAADPAPGDTRELTHLETAIATSDSLHVLDYNLTLGDLLALVEAQAAAFEAD